MLTRLNAHRAWANRLYVDWIATIPSADEYCVKMLSHILLGEEIWLGRLLGTQASNTIWNALPLEAFEPLRQKNEAGWDQVMEIDPSRVFHYRRLDGTEMSSTAVDIATHVCTHGVYHRGQIAARAVRDGLPKPPGTDFILFSREFP